MFEGVIILTSIWNALRSSRSYGIELNRWTNNRNEFRSGQHWPLTRCYPGHFSGFFSEFFASLFLCILACYALIENYREIVNEWVNIDVFVLGDHNLLTLTNSFNFDCLAFGHACISLVDSGAVWPRFILTSQISGNKNRHRESRSSESCPACTV